MEFIPVAFNLGRNSLLPILIVTGITKNVPGMEAFLIRKALEFIEVCEKKFEGKLIELRGHEHDINISEGQLAVRFYILFKTDEDFWKAASGIKKELG